MKHVFALALLCAAACVQAAEVTPVEKVIQLMEDLRSQTESEGSAEAVTYETFACFCKSSTQSKADAIKSEQDNIEGFAATLQEQTSIRNAKAHEIKELDQSVTALDKEIATMTSMRDKAKTRYEGEAADLQKGIAGLEGAISDLSAGKPSSFAQIKATVRKSLLMADTLNANPKHSRAFSAWLQEDDSGAPSGDGEFASDDIIAMMENLLKTFKERKAELDQIDGQNAQDFTATMESKTSEKTTAEEAKNTADGDKSTAEENIATASEDTVNEESLLKDDEFLLKELTESCEMKAREWDQRSSSRAGEVAALTKALDVIKNGAKANEGANKRTLLLQTDARTTEVKIGAQDNAEESDVGDVDLSFLQSGAPRKHLIGLAQKVVAKSAVSASRREGALANLVETAKRLKSPMLISLAMKIQADPFLKVKKLVQELVERLVKEAAAESSKKGWCDTSMGKATHNRNSNMDAVMTLNGEVKALEAKKDTLEEDVATLTTELSELNDGLSKQTKLRTEEKAENMNTLDQAKAGMAAVKDAYTVLEAFYKGGAKAKVALIQASPKGKAYKGNQNAAGGIFAMLDVIISDFDRTLRVVTEAEQEANKAFVDFERASKVSIMTKETGKSQAEMGLKETNQGISDSMEALSQHQKMLDDALKELEDLQPSCVDTGMSYAEKVAKREEEIDALKKAMCMLDGENVEADCPP